MASLTRLNRRLLRWHRYFDRMPPNAKRKIPRGYQRAVRAVFFEKHRRQCHTVYWPLSDHLDRWGL